MCAFPVLRSLNLAPGSQATHDNGESIFTVITSKPPLSNIRKKGIFHLTTSDCAFQERACYVLHANLTIDIIP